VLGPLAWSAAFGFWLVWLRFACRSRDHGALVLSAVAAALVIAAGVRLAQRRIADRPAGEDGRPDVARLLYEVAIGSGLVSLLLVALSTLPMFLLGACPS
jgi:hypothetical protein